MVSVEGRAVRTDFEYDRAAESFRRGQAASFVVERDDRQWELDVVPGAPFEWGAWALNAIACLVHLALAALVLLSGHWDRPAQLLAILAGAIAIELVLPFETVGLPVADLVATAAYWVLTGLQYGVELHLASRIPGPRRFVYDRPWVVPGFYAVGGTYGALMLARSMPGPLGETLIRWTSPTAVSALLEAWYLLWPLGVAALFGFAAWRWPERLGRQQALLVFVGLLPWVVLTLAIDLAELFGGGMPSWVEVVQPLCLAIYPISLFIALYRYHLFDFELVVRRSLLYSALTSSLFLVFYAALGIGGALTSRAAGAFDGSVWVLAGATLVLGLLFAPLRDRLQRLIGRRFFPERAALRERLSTLARELPRHGQLREIGQVLVDEVRGMFGAQRVALLLGEGRSGVLVRRATSIGSGDQGRPNLLLSPDDPFLAGLKAAGVPDRPRGWKGRSTAAEQLAATGIELAVPICTDDRLIGVLLVGRRPGDVAYRSEEIDLLDLLSHHVATVLDNVALFESATTDSLTGLLRREAILEDLDRELERARRYRRPLSIALADIDHFKGINDTYGHLVGDLALQQVAGFFTGTLRSTDLAGRFGGEEFLLILPETPGENAVGVMDKLRVALGDLVVETGRGSLSMTVSIGVASVDELSSPGDADQLLAIADRRLYEAKNGGRNRVAGLA
ncbi:MAG: GGDEF domain-containing protein [Thermoanaerobaculia bacterium]